MAAPKTLIPGPARTGLAYGLLSVLPLPEAADARWGLGGAEWESLNCEAATGTGDPCADLPEGQTAPVGIPKVFEGGMFLSEATPFTVIGTYKCNPVGNSIQHAQDMATQHLQTREEARAEQAVWTGDLGNTPALATATTTVLTVALTPVTPSAGIGLLEKWLGTTYGSLGVIHVDRALGLALIEKGVIITSGTRASTVLGTPVVIGAGYPGTGPTGQAGTWAYATPAMIGRRSEVFSGSDRPGDLLDRGTNDLYGIAERTYLVGWDECAGVATVEIAITPVVPAP